MITKDPTLHEALVEAIADHRTLLDEDIGKQLLAAYGIRVPRGLRLSEPDQLRSVERELGYPLVVKVIAPGLLHKTDVGAVRLGIGNLGDLEEAAEELWTLFPGAPLLVEEMVGPGVELILGVTEPAGLGPSLMLGFGGVLTEIFEDVAFLGLPATEGEIRQALAGLRSFELLTGFRGRQPCDIDEIVATIARVAQLGLNARGYYSSIDINPLLVSPDAVTAVDVKILPRPDGPVPRPEPPPADIESVARFFSPGSVAVVGASSTPGKPGHEVIRNLLDNDYAGKIHLVNPKGGELLGLPVYRSVDDLPEGIDLAIIILSAESSLEAVRDVARRGIRSVVLAAGGFAETDEHGEEVQRDLCRVLRENGMHALGPNTSGHISTPANFTSSFFHLGKIRRGSVSYIAQTGNFATHSLLYILSGEHFGVSRVVGLGNKADIDESVALEYLLADPETDAILMYLESIEYPERFMEIARRATRSKPVVLLKAGATPAGRDAATAHTAAMATEDRLVEGMLRQTGVVRLRDYTELINVGKALSMLPLPKGKGMSFLAPSGAMLASLADLCTRLGLDVAECSEETVRGLQEISPAFVRMRNPVDIWPAVSVLGVEGAYREALATVLKDPGVAAAVIVLMLSRVTGIPSYDFIVDLAKKHPDKPVIVTFSGDKACMDECKAYLEPRGIPTFPEIEQPFEVLSILYRCSQALKRK